VSNADAGSSAVQWYRDEIDRALHDTAVRDAHPKVHATVAKASQLWLKGQKCLIFCWFIRTGEAVERALITRINALIDTTASAALNTFEPDTTNAELERIAERLFRRDSSSYERFRQRLTTALGEAAGGYDDVLELIIDAAIRHLRTPGYLVRYTPLSPTITDEEVWAGISGENPSNVELLDRWRHFAERLAKSRQQIERVDDREDHDSEFARLRSALLGASSEGEAGAGRGASLHPVRRASGQTARDIRERLISLFNTPFAPDLLVASSVMGEGIDLHQECRYVIHHDLDWNPSVLEQRTGRLDRIGALAEREGLPIQVYEPYLAGTHDEKMFRVVKDRAGWFDIVMGRPNSGDEHATDLEEHRLPLHAAIATALTMDLTSPARP
jgi:superfamily II DNA or RNA helicase